MGIYFYEALGETCCAFKWYFPFSFKHQGIYIKVTPLSPAMIIMFFRVTCQASQHQASQVSITKCFERPWKCILDNGYLLLTHYTFRKGKKKSHIDVFSAITVNKSLEIY